MYSEDELEDVGRRVYRVSSDDSSSLYSNNEPGVAASTNPFTGNSAPRAVSPSLGFEGFTDEPAQDPPPTLVYHRDEPELLWARSLETSSTTPRNASSSGTIINSPQPSRPRALTPAPPQLCGWAAVLPRRPRGSTPTPTPAPNRALPQQVDWTPVKPRLSAPPHPDRAPPATPLPPAIPSRKRPSLTGEEMSTIVKRADATLETRQLSTGNIPGGQAIQGSSTSPDSKAPELVPECLRVNRVRDSEGPALTGYGTPQLVSATRSQFEIMPTQFHDGPSTEHIQFTANRRRRNHAPDLATYRDTSMDQETGLTRQDFSFSPQSERMSSPAAPLPTPHDARSELAQRVPAPAEFAHPSSASRETLASSDVSTWHPASIRGHSNDSGVLDPDTNKSGKHASTLTQDQESITQASERLREMGSGYATQRAEHRPAKSTDISEDFGSGFAVVDSASGNGVVRADHPSYQEASKPPKASFKEKMRGLRRGTAKITGMLKLRKSSKDMRKDSRTPDGSLDKTSMESGRKTPGLMKKVRSIPSFARLRQRSHMDLRKTGEDGNAPPVPAIPLRHRKTSAQVAGERRS